MSLAADPVTSNRHYQDDEMEYMRAVESFKGSSGKKFLTHCDHFAVMKSMGYRRGVPLPTDDPADVYDVSVYCF